MSKKRKGFKFLGLIVAFSIVALLALTYYFYANEAPITKGQISFHVNYKDDLSLDIYHPTEVIHEKSPIVLFIHGGAWIAGRKESMNVNRVNGAINQLRDHGFTVVSIEYTLAENGLSPFPECIIDGFDAIKWISTHADSLNLDPGHFGVIGESAGAHIAMMNAFASPSDFELPYAKIDMDYVVDIYGPSNLYKLYRSETLDSIMTIIKELPAPLNERLNLASRVFGFNPEEDLKRTKAFADRHSPSTYLNPHLPPVLMVHGLDDQIVPVDQTTALKVLLDSLAVNNEVHYLEHTNHAFIGADDQQKAMIQDWIFNFIENNRLAKQKKVQPSN